MKTYLSSVMALVLVLGIPVAASAIPITFFGEDPGLGEAMRLPAHPLADTARANFLSNLIGVAHSISKVLPMGPAPHWR
jgi:hypothetical protein